MIIMLFGVSNVGKSATGEKLAEKLGYTFCDMDEEIKARLHTTLEQLMKDYPFPHERFKLKGKILKDIVVENKDKMVIAVSPIYYSGNFNRLLEMENIVAIELQDSKEHIFERLVFPDENDKIYRDDEYKESHKEYYLKEIHEDIVYVRKVFKKIKNKYFIDNKSVDQVVEDLMVLLKGIDSGSGNTRGN